MSDVPDWVESIIKETTCEYCGAEIVYARTRKGVGVFDKDSWRPHRLSCPYADRWTRYSESKKKEARQMTLEDLGILKRDE
ncbi:hypothetical protein J5U23_02879 [Saccharolobus shibatae B12]|uniref:Uncharacterized protein n=1 Tax=Saccharolobus shibatae (strain ATCC 51178 / DSM 5389 / JCM 8931 / NBRC 15437 / B12) TaxID=523848 RepID=A0A8F5BKJ2_SACSH|nr:hypothetical protein [Saccharolobus shibatae]QXJ27097.1 hypothetical protein J5U23_p2879 [Saccharolobus shibatae B12]QXJ29990.1 hypothetical protein J5U23_02879 [Saccharolobus shibatae B12]